MSNSIQSKQNGFFSASGDSDSDSESDGSKAVVPRKVDLRKMFYEYVEDPPLNLGKAIKESASPTSRFFQHLAQNNKSVRPDVGSLELVRYYVEKQPLGDFGSKSRQVAAEYLETVARLPDSPRRKLRSREVYDALDLFSTKLSSQPKNSAAYHNEALGNFFRLQGEIQGARQIVCDYPHTSTPPFLPLINLAHITSTEASGGYHFFNFQEDLTTRIIAENPFTGVYCGDVLIEGTNKRKFSTFFPPSVDSQDALVRVVQEAEKIAQRDNRLLYRTRTDVAFYLEKLFQEGGCVVTSAYPLFFFGDMAVTETFHITSSFTLMRDDILDALANLATVDKHTRYVLGDEVIVDVAPLFLNQTGGIRSGIDFRFRRSIFQS